MLQVVASRVDCLKKDSELIDLRIASDEAVSLAESADAKRKQIETCFDQEIHNVTKNYEAKVLTHLCYLGHLLTPGFVCGPRV